MSAAILSLALIPIGCGECGREEAVKGVKEEAPPEAQAPATVEGYFREAAEKAGISDFQGTIESYTRAIELDPKQVSAYFNRGNARVRAGDSPGAIADFTRVIELDPTSVMAYYSRGVSKQRSGDQEGACQDWRKAGELGNKDALELVKKFCP